MAAWTSARPTRISLSYRAVCEARTALEEVRGLLTGEEPETKAVELALALNAASERYNEAVRSYNEAILRCPE